MKSHKYSVALGIAVAVTNAAAAASGHDTAEAAQMYPRVGWQIDPVFTVGETIKGYTPPGILDGIGAFSDRGKTVKILANHELNAEDGYAYALKNRTLLTGARVSFFDIDKKERTIQRAGLAYDKAYDRAGDLVVDASQINEGNAADPASEGFDRFCSAYGFEKGTDGLLDDVFFTGEETWDGFDTIPLGDGSFGPDPARTPTGFGGQETVIDVRDRTIYVAPMLGRAAFENVCTVENFGSDKVVIVIGDDRQAAPLYLYIGEKGAAPEEGYYPPRFLKRNGLGLGNLYVWVAAEHCGSTPAVRDPESFNGTGSMQEGVFCRIEHFDPNKAGADGYDSLGFASMATQDANAETAGAFRFSRPEDVSGNPEDGTQIVMASTGRGGVFPSDNWGTVYIIDLDDHGLAEALADDLDAIDGISAKITILLDADDPQFRDFGVRSADNLDWADNGMIYINEDRSTVLSVLKDPAGCQSLTGEAQQACLDDAFGGRSKTEASIWEVDPLVLLAISAIDPITNTSQIVNAADLVRIAVINRDIELPDAQTDSDPLDLGDWESSGVLDITELFATQPGERLLIADTQAHSVRDGTIGGVEQLVQGGQLFFLSKQEAMNCDGGHVCDDDDDDDKDDDRKDQD